jgi:hypothetical protein
LIASFDDLKNLPKDYPAFFVSRGAYYLGMEKMLMDEIKFKKPDGEFTGVYSINLENF